MQDCRAAEVKKGGPAPYRGILLTPPLASASILLAERCEEVSSIRLTAVRETEQQMCMYKVANKNREIEDLNRTFRTLEGNMMVSLREADGAASRNFWVGTAVGAAASAAAAIVLLFVLP